MVSIAKLRELADAAILEGQEQDRQIDRIAAYCEAFDAWSAEARDGRASRETLLALQQKHKTIMALAEALKSSTGVRLKGFKKRARQIMDYASQGAQRVSSRKRRNG